MSDFTRWLMRLSYFERRFPFLRTDRKERVCQFDDTMLGPHKRCPRRLSRVEDSLDCGCRMFEIVTGIDYLDDYDICTWPETRGGKPIKKQERQREMFT